MTHAPAPPAYDPGPTDRAYARAVSRTFRTEEVWAAARQLYSYGASGPEVMERYGIGRSAFYERARKEGWRRVDQMEEPLQDEYDRNPAQLRRGAAEMAIEAWAATCRAIDRGRLAEARGWARLHRELREMAVEQAKGTLVVAFPGDDDDPDAPVQVAYMPHAAGRVVRPAAAAAAALAGPGSDPTDLTDSFSESGGLAEPRVLGLDHGGGD